MPSRLGLPVQDIVVSSDTAQPVSDADVRSQDNSSHVMLPPSHPERQQPVFKTHSTQTSGSEEISGSSSSPASSAGIRQSGSPAFSSSPVVSTVPSKNASCAGQPSTSLNPDSLTSPASLRPHSAGFNRRKIFGRSNSIRDMLGVSGSNEDNAPTTANPSSNGLHHVSSSPATLSAPSTKEHGLGFLRHMGSKSFLNLSDSKGMSTSSDHLPLTSPDSQGSKRLSDSLKIFGRRRGRSVSKGLEDPKGTMSEFGQTNRNKSETLLTASTRRSGDSSGSVGSSERKQKYSDAQTGRFADSFIPADSPVGLPKRFSGWLHNMVGSEPTDNSADGTMLSPVKEVNAMENTTGHFENSKTGEVLNQDTLSESPAHCIGKVSPQTDSALLTSPKSSVGSRAGALLQNLTSGPSKAAKPNTAVSPNSGSGWGPSGVGIDRAFRFFLDNDAESKAEEGIWLLGVWHGPTPETGAAEPTGHGADILPTSPKSRQMLDLDRLGEETGQIGTERHSQHASSSTTAKTVSSIDSERLSSPSTSLSRATSNSIGVMPDWRNSFQSDFSSRIWCTYRNHFAPINRDGAISDEAASAAELLAAPPMTQPELTFSKEVLANRNWLGRKGTESMSSTDQPGVPSTMSPIGLGAALGASYATATSSLGDKMGISNLWGRATAAAQAAGFSRGLTTDAGWGCMLRTGQSLLANALMDVHLGRSWQRGPPPLRQHQLHEQLSSSQADQTTVQESLAAWRQKRRQYATYVRILSWFFDDASPASPFSVHRMAREGRRLGKEVGEWFGPSTASGAIKELVSNFSEAGIGVVLDHDGVFHLNEVRDTSVQQVGASSRRKPDAVWQRPVLILVGIRLGLESVNPIYYESVKATFSFPQSVGIAGGRPSSSYYFMGHQGNSLFYLDPHNVRPAVPLRFPPKTFPTAVPEHLDVAYRYETDPKDDEEEWWAHAYGETQTSTFHCEKVRRMPIKSLDPSMLLGFLVKDETSLLDLCARIKALPKTIFSFADSAPTWIDDDDFDPSMESFSESSVGGDFDDADGGTDILTGPHALTRKLARASLQHAGALSASDLDSTTIAKQRTAEWLGQGNSSSPRAGIAFPLLDAQDSQPLRRPSRTDTRLVSSTSTMTARPGINDRQEREPRASVGRANALTSVPHTTDNMAVLDDDSFSTMHLSGSEVDSGWEEVSEVGTIAPSASAAAVAHLVLGESQPSQASDHERLSDADARTALVDSVLVERPSTTRAADSSELMADMVAVSLDTPVGEVPRTSAKPSDQARVSMELSSVGTNTPSWGEPAARSAQKDETTGYFGPP